MKRKREHKKKKTKGDLIDGNSNGSDSGDGSSSEEEIDNNINIGNDDVVMPDVEGQVEVNKAELPSQVPVRAVNVRPDGVIQRPPTMAVYGRVRVKLKTAAKPPPPSQPQSQAEPEPQPQLQSEPEPEPERGLVDAKGGGDVGVSNEGEVDKSVKEVRMEKMKDGGGSGEKKAVVVESGNSVPAESKKPGGMGIKIVSSKSSNLRPPGGGDEGVSNGSEVDKSMEEVRVEKTEGGGGSGEKVVVESGNSISAESKKPGGVGIKIVSSKSSNLSPSGGGNVKKSGGSDEGASNGNEVDKSMKEVGVEKTEDGGGSGEKVVVESGNSISAEGKKPGGMGIKIVSSKSSNLSHSGGGNVNESGGGDEGVSNGSEVDKNMKDVGVEKTEDGGGNGEKMVMESGNLISAESKKPCGMGIKIVSSKSSNLSPSGGGNVKESGGGRVSPKADVEEGGLVEESENSGSAESKKSGGVGIKIVSSKSSNLSPPGGGGGANVKESGGARVLPKADVEEGELVEESGNSGSAESKKSGGLGIKIMSSKSSNLSPPGGDNIKESDGSRVSPKEDVEEGELVEESGNSGSAESKKSGGMGIKIVSSKSSNLIPPGGGNVKESSGSRVSPIEEGELVEVEVKVKVKEEKPKSSNRQELEVSLEVIKKVMRMDAAEPFNAPVNPIELGIPDYFDVIDTPMDFGTIRSNLESRTKYMDSEDVYKDAQYVWDNCFKYNNKGDYIVDLMRRVKKNFMKYWVAAGLYTEHTKKMTGSEGTGADEPTTSGNGKKLKKGKGYKLHKDDCLCAICIMRRRRREREAREAEEARAAGIIVPSPQIRVPQTSVAGGYKQEENSHAESPGENTSSYMETSPDGEGDAEMEDGEMRLESIASHFNNQPKAGDDRITFHDKYDRSGDISEKLLQKDKGVIELYSHGNTGSRMMIDAPKQLSVRPEEPPSEYLKQRHEQLELEKKRQRLRLLETFRDLENPMLSELCGTLFPNNVQSVWNGANSLLRCQKSRHQKSGIVEAVASFIRPSCKSASSLK